MREFEVLFATKQPGTSGHPEPVVTEIGAMTWKMSRDNAIGWLNADDHTFYVKVAGQKVYLVVAPHEGQSWLRTHKDWSQPNPLLSLPEFPADYGQ